MNLFGDAIFYNDNESLKATILVSDVFSQDNDLKAMLAVFCEDFSEAELMERIDRMDNLKCLVETIGITFEIDMKSIYRDCSFCSGHVATVFIVVENYESSELVMK